MNETQSTTQPEHEQPAIPSNEVLDALATGALGPLTRVTETVELTLDELSQWIAEATNRKQLARLVSLLNAQTQLLVAQHQLFAAARLAEVASTARSPETVRRACADLLRVRLFDPYREEKRPQDPPVPPRITERNILDALERFGEFDETTEAQRHGEADADEYC